MLGKLALTLEAPAKYRPRAAIAAEWRAQARELKLAEAAIPAIGPSPVLLKTKFLSLDPYMRGRMSDAKSYAPRLPSASPLAAKQLASEMARRQSAIWRRGSIS